jgi:uncharacterized protein YceH (UPF0502 family)
MHRFTDTDEVEGRLEALAGLEPPLVRRLSRAPGTKEPRWAHLLSGEPATAAPAGRAEPERGRSAIEDDLEDLRIRVAALEEELRRLKEQLGV